ncbi:DUF4349 domain-containing protein [Terrabacter sp. NPDC080008]|uniref:DUF4349 domain-containing protein n=1 Tax=Terrabacter sp. NPDC080008 TaxID=3155176 RepID=UPI00344F5BCB
MTTISHPSPRPRASRLHRPRGRLVAVVAVVVVLVAVAVPLGLRATGGGASSVGASVAARPGAAANGSADSTGSRGASGSAGAGADAGAGSPPGAAASGTASDVVIGPKVSRSAWLGLKVSDLGTASARARVVATHAGGQVTSENVVTSVDPTGGQVGDPQNGGVGSSSTDTAPSPGTGSPTGSTARSTPGSAGSPAPSVPQVGVDQARMVLNVPSKALDEVLTQLSALGAVSYRSSQSEDVTDTYIDTKARIQPLQDGIERVRALLAKTTDLQQVITLESELSRRQADLDSLTQRLAQLDAETTTSDVTVSMWTDATPPAQTAPGFIGGLHSAWDSLLGSLTVVLTGLAALLPWLVLLTPLVLLGLRVRRRRGTGASAARSSSQAAD